MKEQTVFPKEVLEAIQIRSQGIPRMINAICDNLLLTAFALEKREATIEMLDEVSRDMRLEWPGNRNRGQQSRHNTPVAAPVAPPDSGFGWER